MKVRAQLGSLANGYSSLQDRHRRLVDRSHELDHACARSSSESQELAWKLVQIGGRIGQITAHTLNKIKERILIVKHVEKIKEELHKSARTSTTTSIA